MNQESRLDSNWNSAQQSNQTSNLKKPNESVMKNQDKKWYQDITWKSQNQIKKTNPSSEPGNKSKVYKKSNQRPDQESNQR